MIWIAFKVTLGICSEPLIASLTRKGCREGLNNLIPPGPDARWTEPKDDGSVTRFDGSPFLAYKIIKMKLS